MNTLIGHSVNQRDCLLPPLLAQLPQGRFRRRWSGLTRLFGFCCVKLPMLARFC